MGLKIEIKPCPFCGTAGRTETQSNWFGCGCPVVECNGHLYALRHTSEEDAIDAWNTRKSAGKRSPVAWLYQKRDQYNSRYFWATSTTHPKFDPYFNPEVGKPTPLFK